MEYLLLIHEPRGQRATRTPEQGQAAYAAMQGWAEQLQRRGLLRGVNSLQDDARGTRVQVREGGTRLLDGPFTETKEMVGGYFLLDCDGHAQAVAVATECPAAAWATVEVRPVGPCFL